LHARNSTRVRAAIVQGAVQGAVQGRSYMMQK
jgi:hypothetical protein